MMALFLLGILLLLAALFFVGCAIVTSLGRVEKQLRWQNEHLHKTPPPVPTIHPHS